MWTIKLFYIFLDIWKHFDIKLFEFWFWNSWSTSGQINVRFFFKSHKNGPKKPDIYLTGPGINFFQWLRSQNPSFFSQKRNLKSFRVNSKNKTVWPEEESYFHNLGKFLFWWQGGTGISLSFFFEKFWWARTELVWQIWYILAQIQLSLN